MARYWCAEPIVHRVGGLVCVCVCVHHRQLSGCGGVKRCWQHRLGVVLSYDCLPVLLIDLACLLVRLLVVPMYITR